MNFTNSFLYLIIYASVIMNTSAQSVSTSVDNSDKTILARGCDPTLSLKFSKMMMVIFLG